MGGIFVELPDDVLARYRAYAKVKGYKKASTLASVALELVVSRNRPTAAQQARIDIILGVPGGGGCAGLHSAPLAIVKEG
jgi:hypothetical protein